MALRYSARALTRMAPVLARRASTTANATASASRSLRAFMAAAGVGTALFAFDRADASWTSWLFGTPDFDAIRGEVEQLIDDETCGPLLVRLAWHSSGTYDKDSNTGGSNGATMRFAKEAKDPANAGLEIARNLLEPIKAKYPKVTYADLYTFAGAVAVEYMGGPKIPWKSGRVDYEDDSKVPPNGRLPDASQGASHVRDVFYRMGFNDQEIVALVGAHTLGRCHTDRSGYDGPWTFDPNGFDNDYFTRLLNDKWTIRPKFQPTQYQDPTGELMMLPADMVMITDPEFRKWSVKYSEDMDKFHQDFAVAFGKLLELGVPR